MRKTYKKILSKILVVAIMFTMIPNTAFANSGLTEGKFDLEYASIISNDGKDSSVVVTDNGVYINGTYYSQEQFMELLDTAEEVETPSTRSSVALVAGTWYIPGVGQVVITVAGVIVVGGVVVAAGSWIDKAVKNWFAARAFNKSAKSAVNNCDSNKRHHIMNSKHNWNKFNKDPKWNNIAPILIKTLKKGSEQWERGDQYIRTLVYKGETVVVRFIKGADGLVKHIGTAWCE
jgi:hypothetical protein